MGLSKQGRLQFSLSRLLRSTQRYAQRGVQPNSSKPLIQSTPSPSSLNEDLTRRLRVITNGEANKYSDANMVTETLKEGLWSSVDEKKKKKKKKKKVLEPESGLAGWSGESWKRDWGEDSMFTVYDNLASLLKAIRAALLNISLSISRYPSAHQFTDCLFSTYRRSPGRHT